MFNKAKDKTNYKDNDGKDSNERFEVIYKQGKLSGCKIFVDTKTGVNYVFCYDGYAGGLTVLLDNEGKPVITHI